MYPIKDVVEIQDPTDSHKNLKMDIIEEVKKGSEEWKYINLFHYWTNTPVFSGWLKGPEYTVRINWLA